MKHLIFTLLISISIFTYGQAPQEISYQGIARNSSGSLLANQNIGIKLDLHQGSAAGPVIFSEAHNKTTNPFGLFTLGIGSVNNASFTGINWANGPYYLEVSMDPSGGTSYSSVGTQQFMSVPFALYAQTSGNASPIPTISVNAPNTVTSAGGSYSINIPAATVYTAGTGINVSGSTISNTAPDQTITLNATGSTTVTGTYPNFTINTPTVAPDQTVSLSGAGSATITGVYPNFTVNVPAGTNLPNAYSGQFMYNNGLVWDTLPRTNFYFDGSNMGVGTTTPQATFHVVGAGRFDASISSPQIYANALHLAVGTFTNAGDVLTNDGAGNAIWQTLPAPNLSYNNGTNVLTFSQGTVVTTATLVGTGSNTISVVGGGMATVTPTTGSTFTVSVPNPTLSINSGSLTISNGNSVVLPSPSLTVNSNSLTINGPGGNTVLLPSSPATSVTPGVNVNVTGSAPNYTISAPAYSISIPGGNVVQITNGISTSTSAINATSLTLTGTNNNVLSAGGNTVALNTYTPGTGISMTGTAPNYTLSSPNQSLTINSNSLSITGGNTVTLPIGATTSLTPGTNVSILGSAPSYTVSSVTPSLNVVGGSLIGSYPSQTLTIPTSSTTVITGSTGINVTGTAPNYTLSSPNQSLSVTGNSLSITGANTVTIPTASVVAGNANIIVNQAGNTFSVSGIASPLSLIGTTLTSGPPTNSVSLSSLAVWSNSGGVLHPTLLSNGVGVGTGGPLTDKMEINHPSSTSNSHLHLKQTGGDAFARLKFTNAAEPTKFWMNSVTSAANDPASGYNVYYYNGSVGHNVFTVSGDGLVSVNKFGTLNNAGFYVGGKAKIDSSLSMAAYNFPPFNSQPNEGKIYFDRTAQKFKVSENGGAYVDLIGGAGTSPWIQGTGIITQSNPGDFVGIGTVSPTSPLHVYGMADPLQISVENTGGNFKTGYQIKTALSEWFMGQDGNTATGFRITDKDASAVRFQIDQDGHVGIGTTFPTEKLDVSGNIRTDSSLMVTGMGTVPPISFGGSGRIFFDQVSGKFKVSENGSGYVDLVGGASPWMQGSGIITQNNLGDLVGIGTSSPEYRLDVRNFSDAIINLSSSSSSQGTLAGLRLSMYDGYVGKQYTLGAEKSDAIANSGSSDFVIKSHYSTAGGTLNNLVIKGQDLIFNESKSTGFAFGNVIVANGNLGVGNALPSFKLDVNGNARFSTGLESNGQVYVANSGNYQSIAVSENGGLGAGLNLQATGGGGRSYTIFSANTSGILEFHDDNANAARMVISPSGNVGIGTTAPTAKMQINGSVRILDGTQGPGKVLTSDAAGNASWQDATRTVFLKDVKPSGTSGGTFTSGGWRTRTLNTIEGDGSLVSLVSNQFTLQPGIYIIKVDAPAYTVMGNQLKLRNLTDGTDDIIGQSNYANVTGNVNSNALLSGILNITTSKLYEIQHQCQSSSSGSGFGVASGFGPEVYTIVQITKIK